MLFFNFLIHKFTTCVVMIFDPLYRICHERIPKTVPNRVLSEAGFKKRTECFGVKTVKEGGVKILTYFFFFCYIIMYTENVNVTN